MLMTRIMGTLRTLDKAPAAFYIERHRGYDGPYRTEQEARAALGEVRDDAPAPGTIVWWSGRPS